MAVNSVRSNHSIPTTNSRRNNIQEIKNSGPLSTLRSCSSYSLSSINIEQELNFSIEEKKINDSKKKSEEMKQPKEREQMILG